MTLPAIQQQKSQNRSRSERKRTPKMLKAICELVRNGLSVRHAAEKLHVHHTTVGRWRNELPDFDTSILAAEAEFIETEVANIRTAAKTSWQASAWMLERRFPQCYSQPQVQLNMPAAKIGFEDLPSLMERLEKCPSFQKSLAADSNVLVIDVPALPAHHPQAETPDGKTS
jgi:hypothetical protein